MESVREYANRHRVSTTLVAKWINQKRIIAEKKGGCYILLGLQDRPKNLSKTIIQSDENGRMINKFSSVKEAAEKVGTTAINIYRAMNDKSARAKGFYWISKNDI